MALTAPTLDSVVVPNKREIDLEWTKNDTSTDGEFEVHRSTDGTNFSIVADGLSPSTTSYTDTGLLDGVKYTYKIARVDANGDKSFSSEKATTTPIPQPTDYQVDAVVQDDVDLSWTDNSNNEQGYRVYGSTDEGGSWTNLSGDISPTTTYTAAGLRDGEKYRFALEVFTDDATTTIAPGTQTKP